ncbi:MAG: hypothetical protein Q9204_004629 [Flavoplaca sp. TL-2023a]
MEGVNTPVEWSQPSLTNGVCSKNTSGYRWLLLPTLAYAAAPVSNPVKSMVLFRTNDSSVTNAIATGSDPSFQTPSLTWLWNFLGLQQGHAVQGTLPYQPPRAAEATVQYRLEAPPSSWKPNLSKSHGIGSAVALDQDVRFGISSLGYQVGSGTDITNHVDATEDPHGTEDQDESDQSEFNHRNEAQDQGLRCRSSSNASSRTDITERVAPSEDDNGAESQDESHGARRSSPVSKGTEQTDISEVRVQDNRWEIFADIRVILDNWVKNGFLTPACFNYIDFEPEYRRSNGEIEWQWTTMEKLLTNKEWVANAHRFQVYGTPEFHDYDYLKCWFYFNVSQFYPGQTFPPGYRGRKGRLATEDYGSDVSTYTMY